MIQIIGYQYIIKEVEKNNVKNYNQQVIAKDI